jgi:hypothetical protein
MAENMFEISPDGKTLKVVAIGKYKETMVVPDGVQKIAREAFRKNLAYGGDVLKKVVLPEGLKTIGIGAFNKCKTLEGINLPDTLTKIEDEAFLGCKALTAITIPAKLKTIGGSAFCGCPLTTITFTDGSKLTEIGEGAFKGVFIQTLTLPKGVKKLGSWAFAECKNLKTVVLPEGIESFEKYEVFRDCTALESINIPASLTNLGHNAFKGCTALKNITVDPANPAYVMKDGKLMTKDLQTQIFPIVD